MQIGDKMTERKIEVKLKDEVISVFLTKEMNKKRMKNGKARGSLTINSYSLGEAKELFKQLGEVLK